MHDGQRTMGNTLRKAFDRLFGNREMRVRDEGGDATRSWKEEDEEEKREGRKKYTRKREKKEGDGAKRLIR